MSAPDERLSTLLGGAPPGSIAALPAHERCELADLIEAARTTQSADLEQSFEETLRHVPFPVRAIARKMLLG